jgi:uncharacterized protein
VRTFILALVAACAPLAVAAQIQLPPPVGYVNDFAGIIPAEYETRILGVIEEVRAKSGGEIVVVTLPSLQGRTRDEVALQIGREWGVGQAGEAGDPHRNTGAVILVAPNERDLKIELGTRTNTFVTAAEAGRIADSASGSCGDGVRRRPSKLTIRSSARSTRPWSAPCIMWIR